MNDEVLSQEVEDLIRSMPELGSLHDSKIENLAWRGRLSAVISGIDMELSIRLRLALTELSSNSGNQSWRGETNVIALLHEARHKLRMRSPTATSMVVKPGAVYEYFDEVRKIITTATTELFFVDPYIDADFVSRYLTQINPTIFIRILSNKSIPALVGAVDMFAKQHGHKIEVRSTAAIHDRYVFLDRKECYQSGASFKDGAKNAPAGIVQVVDAAAAMLATYEGLWSAAKTER